jgi:uncharacterized membrane protein (DUF106 family)
MFALFNAIDDFFSFMPEALRLALYGLVVGVVAMLIYRLTSPQKRLKAIKQQMADARAAMRSYTGTDASEMLRLSARAIAPALRQLLYVLGPTILAMLPVLLVVLWLEARYSNQLPNSGDIVNVTVLPSDSPVFWSVSAVETLSIGHYALRWPSHDARVQLLYPGMKAPLLNLPLDRPMSSITKWRWWHRVLDAGEPLELPADAPIESITFDMPARHVWSVGPSWMRTWHTPFMAALTVAALGMKFALKIH